LYFLNVSNNSISVFIFIIHFFTALIKMYTDTVLLSLVVLIVTVMLVLQIVYVVRPNVAMGSASDPDDVRENEGADGSSYQHVSGLNRVGDPFLYDGTYYVLRLGDVNLSSPETLLKYSTMITNGHVMLNTSTNKKYAFSRTGIKMVYHDNATIYLVIPVSYAHDWLNKGYITIKDETYVLTLDVQVIATSPLPVASGMRIPLALPTTPTLPKVFRGS
jgi:hypothetical protein